MGDRPTTRHGELRKLGVRERDAGANIVVTNNGASAVTVPVSRLWATRSRVSRSALSTAGRFRHGRRWRPDASITITATPPSITSAATATAEVGSPFTFTVTTSGSPPVTVAETGTLPAA